MHEDWSLLGGDPAPGNLDQVWALGKFIEGAQKDALATQRELRALAAGSSDLTWSGLAATATRKTLGRLAGPHLDVFAHSYGLAASAVFAYAEDLQTMQSFARKLLAQAQDVDSRRPGAHNDQEAKRQGVLSANARLDSAAGAVKQLSAQINHADAAAAASLGTQLTAANQELARARLALDEANRAHESARAVAAKLDQQLAGLRRQADGVRTQIDDSAKRTQKHLHDAARQRVKQPNFVQQEINTLIEVEKAGFASDELQKYLDVLADAVKFVNEAMPLLMMTPLGPYAAVAILGIDLVVMAGHEMQRMGGRKPTQSIWKDLGNTAVDGSSAVLVGAHSAGLLGDMKRSMWYDDARRATGGWHELVHASPKLTGKLIEMFPTAAPKYLFRAATLVEAEETVKHDVDDGKKLYQTVRCPFPHGGGQGWKGVVADGQDASDDVKAVKDVYDDTKQVVEIVEVSR